jgi:hypothetical protein
MAASNAAANRSARDKARSAYLKRHSIERRNGRCVICNKMIGNDTFGGREAWNHYQQHARGYRDE